MVKRNKKGKVGKRRRPCLSNEVYSFLLYQIACGNNYAQKIYEKNIKKYGTKSKVSVITRQLKILQVDDFVDFKIVKDKINHSRRKEYFIIWKPILEFFHIFFSSDLFMDRIDEPDIEKGEITPYLGGDYIFDFLEKAIDSSKKNKSNVFDTSNPNKFLKDFLKEIFEYLGRKSKTFHLESLFELLPELFIHSVTSLNKMQLIKIEKKIKKNPEFRDFVEMMILYYSAYNLSSKYESVQKAIENFLEREEI